MSEENRFKGKLNSLVRFTPLGRALIWEALVRRKRKEKKKKEGHETKEGEEGFKITEITEKWEPHHSSVGKQIENLEEENWLLIQKKDGKRPIWVLRERKWNCLKDWFSKHLTKIAEVLHTPQTPLVARWLFEEIGKDPKSVEQLRKKLLELNVQSDSSKLRNETVINRAIESIFRFFAPYIEEKFKGRGGKRTFYFQWGEKPPILTSNQWKLPIPGKIGEEVEAKQTRPFGVDLSTSNYLSPGIETDFTLEEKQTWKGSEIKKEKLNQKIGNTKPNWALFKFTGKKQDPKVSPRCLNCQETIEVEQPPVVTVTFNESNSSPNSSLKTNRGRSAARKSVCIDRSKKICEPFRRMKPRRDVIVLLKCSKEKPPTTLYPEMFIPSSFSQYTAP